MTAQRRMPWDPINPFYEAAQSSIEPILANERRVIAGIHREMGIDAEPKFVSNAVFGELLDERNGAYKLTGPIEELKDQIYTCNKVEHGEEEADGYIKDWYFKKLVYYPYYNLLFVCHPDQIEAFGEKEHLGKILDPEVREESRRKLKKKIKELKDKRNGTEAV